MTALHIVQVNITDDSDKTITGIYEFDRSRGGALVLPSGSVLPSSNTIPGEIFLLTTDNSFYRRDDTNTIWVAVSASFSTFSGSIDNNGPYVTAFSTGSLQNARVLSGSAGISIVDGGGGGNIVVENTAQFTSQSHAAIRQLVHLADGGGPFESFATGATLETGPIPFPTASIWRDASNNKIVEKIITRNLNTTPSTIQWKMYDVNGSTVLATVVDTITYNGVFETLRTRSIS